MIVNFWRWLKSLKDEIRIIEFDKEYQQKVIDFLVRLTTEEFGHPERKDYFAHKLVEQYKIGNNNFWIALEEY